MKMIITIGEVT